MAVYASSYFLAFCFYYFLGFGLSSALRKELPLLLKKDYSTAQRLTSFAVFFPQAVELVLFLFFTLFAIQVGPIFIKENFSLPLFFCLLIYLFSFNLFDRLMLIDQARGQFVFFALVNTSVYIIQRIGAVFLVLEKPSVLLVLGCFTGVYWLSIPWLFWRYRKLLFKTFSKNTFAFLRQALPYYGVETAQAFTSFGDQFLVGLFFPAYTLSGYFIIRRLFDFALTLLDYLRAPLLPRLVLLQESSQTKARTFYFVRVRFLHLFMAIIFGSLVLFNGPVLKIFAGPKYVHFNWLFILMAPVFLTKYFVDTFYLLRFVELSPSQAAKLFLQGISVLFLCELVGGLIGNIYFFVALQILGYFFFLFILKRNL